MFFSFPKTMNLLYQLDDHYIVKIAKKLFKLQPKQEVFIESRLSKLDSIRFCVWRQCVNNTWKLKICKFCQVDPNDYIFSTCDFRGHDLLQLLKPRGKCSCKVKSSGQEFTITQQHSTRFKEYLIDSVNLLSVNNIAHNDIYLRNIIVDFTQQEREAKEISTSWPILIDFGMAEFTEDAKSKNDANLHKLFTQCNHGYEYSQENWVNGIKNQDSNLSIFLI